ncbi:hypothetical protein Apa02nite_034720 [Actinoplanes palleronii]|uniref:WD40 repeat protein n=1 Tax=Actinoplanes palleronii TaxID=113570 RepID=A0ABQ4B9Q5_9ACTN|nr:hypothetical protein Apa02nite_034720 [Actinoplanes palleronii]
MASARTLAPGQHCRILVCEVDSGVLTVVHKSALVLFEAPNWTANDQLVVNGEGLLWSLPADGSAAPQLIPLEGVPELNNDHVLAPDGKDIFLSGNDGHLYRASLAGGPGQRITDAANWMHFLHGVSPDGATLAYVGLEPGRWDAGTLWTIRADGGPSTALTSGPGADDGPEYHPAGDWIYFNTERYGHAQIARIRPNGTAMEQLTHDARVNWFPHFAPDGSRAVYLSYPPGTEGHPADRLVELRLVEGDDWHAARTIVELPGGQGTINVNSWSPDGTRFAYVDYPLAG